MNTNEIAKQLYTTYCEAVGGKAFNGDLLPDWDTFSSDETKKKQSNAWIETSKKAQEIITM